MQNLRLADLRLIHSNQPAPQRKVSISYFMRDAINVKEPKCATYLTIDRKGSVITWKNNQINPNQTNPNPNEIKNENAVNQPPTAPPSKPNFVLIGDIKNTAFFQIPLHFNEIDHHKMERINYQNMQSLFNGKERKQEEQKIKIW